MGGPIEYIYDLTRRLEQQGQTTIVEASRIYVGRCGEYISKIANWYAVEPDNIGYLHPEFEAPVVREWKPAILLTQDERAWEGQRSTDHGWHT